MSKTNTSTNTSGETVTIAGLMRRLAAMVYDGLILMAVLMAYGAIALTVKYSVLGATHVEGEKMELGVIGFAIMLVVVIAFYSFFWMRGGQTVGMKAWRLRLVNNQGLPVDLAQSIKRCIFACLSLGLGEWGIYGAWLIATAWPLTITSAVPRWCCCQNHPKRRANNQSYLPDQLARRIRTKPIPKQISSGMATPNNGGKPNTRLDGPNKSWLV